MKEKGAWGRAKLVLPGNGITARTNREFPDLCAICDVWDIAKVFLLLQYIYPVDALGHFEAASEFLPTPTNQH